ncbi:MULTISPECIES: hypothetical protein [Yersinia pseudotuberculosis complex]|uniref:hypothetical protein n=1 Tax=Yersinia pseudotuberculosis complex TaxID=1649845 RepID=UPI0015F00458|nr:MULTISPECIES: hypothetical protein [Yersinia pseudotuberculosis complex]
MTTYQKPSEPLNPELLHKIVVMLDDVAKRAGKRWATVKLIDNAALVYNFLSQEEQVDDEKIERTLKLVVTR